MSLSLARSLDSYRIIWDLHSHSSPTIFCSSWGLMKYQRWHLIIYCKWQIILSLHPLILLLLLFLSISICHVHMLPTFLKASQQIYLGSSHFPLFFSPFCFSDYMISIVSSLRSVTLAQMYCWVPRVDCSFSVSVYSKSTTSIHASEYLLSVESLFPGRRRSHGFLCFKVHSFPDLTEPQVLV